MKFLIFICTAVIAFGMDIKLVSKEETDSEYVYTLKALEVGSASFDVDELQEKATKKSKEFVINDQGTVFMSSVSLKNNGQLYNDFKTAINELAVTPLKTEVRNSIVNGKYLGKVVVRVDKWEMQFIRKKLKEQISLMEVDGNIINKEKKAFVDGRAHKGRSQYYNAHFGGEPVSVTLDRYGDFCEIIYPDDEKGKHYVRNGGECSVAGAPINALIRYYNKEYLKPNEDHSFLFFHWKTHETKEEFEAIFAKNPELQKYRKAKGKTYQPNPYGIPVEVYDGKPPFEVGPAL